MSKKYISIVLALVLFALGLLRFQDGQLVVATDTDTHQNTGGVVQPPEITVPQDVNVSSSVVSASIVRVVDGDTVVVDTETASNIKVRLIGVNTPETVDPRRAVQCFGTEASEKTKQLLPKGAVIVLVFDETQGRYDKNGRTLAYVERDGHDVGEQLISLGYAYEYTYRAAHPYQRQKEYQSAAVLAQSNKRGLWSVTTCNGQK